MTLIGLVKYGYIKEARTESLKLLSQMYKTYTDFEPHTIWECYSPEKNLPATYEGDSDYFVRKDFCGWSALGPISIYIEHVLGFHTVNAFDNVVKWAKPDMFNGAYGIKNLHFGNVVTDIVANGKACTVTSNAPYTLEIDGKAYEIKEGTTEITF